MVLQVLVQAAPELRKVGRQLTGGNRMPLLLWAINQVSWLLNVWSRMGCNHLTSHSLVNINSTVVSRRHLSEDTCSQQLPMLSLLRVLLYYNSLMRLVVTCL